MLIKQSCPDRLIVLSLTLCDENYSLQANDVGEV